MRTRDRVGSFLAASTSPSTLCVLLRPQFCTSSTSSPRCTKNVWRRSRSKTESWQPSSRRCSGISFCSSRATSLLPLDSTQRASFLGSTLEAVLGLGSSAKAAGRETEIVSSRAGSRSTLCSTSHPLPRTPVDGLVARISTPQPL
jgi:hypothetical protein